MKRFLILTAIAVFALTGCDKPEDDAVPVVTTRDDTEVDDDIGVMHNGKLGWEVGDSGLYVPFDGSSPGYGFP